MFPRSPPAGSPKRGRATPRAPILFRAEVRAHAHEVQGQVGWQGGLGHRRGQRGDGPGPQQRLRQRGLKLRVSPEKRVKGPKAPTEKTDWPPPSSENTLLVCIGLLSCSQIAFFWTRHFVLGPLFILVVGNNSSKAFLYALIRASIFPVFVGLPPSKLQDVYPSTVLGVFLLGFRPSENNTKQVQQDPPHHISCFPCLFFSGNL